MSVEQAEDEQRAMLHRIWRKQADAIEFVLDHTPPEELSASMLTTVNKFLQANGIDVDALDKPGQGPSRRAMSDLVDTMADLRNKEATARLEDHPGN